MCITEANEAATNINSDVNSANEELGERRSLRAGSSSEYSAYIVARRKRSTYILYQDIRCDAIVRAQTMSCEVPTRKG